MSEVQQTRFESLTNYVQQKMKEHRVPGATVGVLHEGETRTAGFGVTNIEHPLDVTTETLFQIGSITKTFTTMVMLRLVEMGKLDLDATVRTYIPDFKVVDKEASAKVTVRHLLTHVGGWEGDFFEDPGPGSEALAKYVTNMAKLEQMAPVGTIYSYNNAGFVLAGRIIEIVAGKPYEDVLREFVLTPLGLTRCYFDPGDVITHRFVVGHDEEDGKMKVARPWPLGRFAYPAGGIVCDVHMLLRYARFHLGNGKVEDGTQVLLQDSLRQMQSPQVEIWKDAAVGLGWHLTDLEGLRIFGHGGGTNGQVSLLTLVPEHNAVLVILTNADKGGDMIDDVQRWFLKTYFGVERKDPEPMISTEEELRAFVGRYVRPSDEVELGLLVGQLVGQGRPKQGFPDPAVVPPPPPPMSLARCEENRLLITSGPWKKGQIDVIRNPDGAIGWLRLGRLYKRVTQ
jgi:CubicO group peptidase (beta-lactamase class C family)